MLKKTILLRMWTWSTGYSHTWYTERLPYLAVSNWVVCPKISCWFI